MEQTAELVFSQNSGMINFSYFAYLDQSSIITNHTSSAFFVFFNSENYFFQFETYFAAAARAMNMQLTCFVHIQKSHQTRHNRPVANSSWRDCVSITLNIKFPTYLVQFYLQVCGITLEFISER